MIILLLLLLVFLFIVIVILNIYFGLSIDYVTLKEGLEALLYNIPVLILTVVVVGSAEGIIERKRLKRINKQKSWYIYFLSNRMALHLLKLLEEDNGLLIGTEDSDLDFHECTDKLKRILKNKKEFNNKFKIIAMKKDGIKRINNFIKTLKAESENLQKTFDGIYPRVSVCLEETLTSINEQSGALGIIPSLYKGLDTGVVDNNKKINFDEDFKTKAKEVIFLLNDSLANIAMKIISISDKAKCNKVDINNE